MACYLDVMKINCAKLITVNTDENLYSNIVSRIGVFSIVLFLFFLGAAFGMEIRSSRSALQAFYIG